MTRGVGDRYRRALRDAEKGKRLEAGGVDDCFEIAHPRVKRQIGDTPIGESAPALVVAQERVARRQLAQERGPDGTFPVEFEVTQPVGDFDQRCALPRRRIGDPYAVAARAKLNPLSRVPRGGLARSEKAHDVSPKLIIVFERAMRVLRARP